MSQYATFEVGGLWLGLAVERVQEVLLAQPLTRVPLAPAEVRGLLNLRGEVVAAIDLGRRLGLGGVGEEAAHLVVWGPEGTVSLLVDALGDVETVEPGGRGPVPATVAGRVREALEGVAEIGGRFLLLLRADRIAGLLQDCSAPAEETEEE